MKLAQGRWLAAFLFSVPAVAGAGIALPQFHFTARRGWTNDPNGLSHYGGEWHLFFQHNPTNVVWGNVHWGHATSPDLVHWTELGDVLAPDENGLVYSGSAVTDEKGVAGFGAGAHVLFYTAAGRNGRPYEQRIAYSTDGRKYIRHPDVAVPQLAKGNRDPKVFYHRESGKWVMLVYAPLDGRHAFRVLNSDNLRQWREVGAIPGDPLPFDTGRRYLFECPDCVELAVEGETTRKWVVFGATLQYGIGAFDGKSFLPEAERLDWVAPSRPSVRRDYYAAQTFSGAPDGRTILMAWYALSPSNAPCTQAMSLPLEMGLRRTARGLRMTLKPVRELESLRDGDAVPLSAFRGELVECECVCRPGVGSRVRLNVRGEEIVFDAQSQTLTACGRTAPWPLDDEGRLALRVYADRLGMEIFSLDGTQGLPVPEFRPAPSARGLAVTTEGDVAGLMSRAWSLRSARAASDVLGFCSHVTRREPLEPALLAVAESGAGWVRSDFDWHRLRKQDGTFDFTVFDRVFDAAERRNLRVLPILVRPPDALGRADGVWEEYVRQAVTHFRGRITAVEIVNEPNVSAGKTFPLKDPANYFDLLRRAYFVVKRTAPEVTVLFGGLAGAPVEYVRKVLEQGGARYFDAMNIHPYCSPQGPEDLLPGQIAAMRGVMGEFGVGNAPIWITEMGWPVNLAYPENTAVLRDGLRVARPGRPVRRAVVVPLLRGADDEDCRFVERMLPEDCRAELCAPRQVAVRLARGDVDLVLFHPFGERYPEDAMEAVAAFVRSGGTLALLGGMPFMRGVREDPIGRIEPSDERNTGRHRANLRLCPIASWSDRRYPDRIEVRATKDLALGRSARKLFADRYFTDRLLRDGDCLVPLLESETNGLKVVAAGVYKFDSDMKGAVIVSGLRDPQAGGGVMVNEATQGRMAARALGVCAALGVDAFFWYALRDVGTLGIEFLGYEGARFGALRENRSERPAVAAVRTFRRMRPEGSVGLREVPCDEKSGLWRPQWIRPDGCPAGMIWTTGAERSLELAFSSGAVSFADWLGRPVKAEPCGAGRWRVKVSDEPVYFVKGELQRWN